MTQFSNNSISGFVSRLIADIGTTLMLDNKFNKLLYYKDHTDENIYNMPDLDNPIKELKDKKIFYGRRIDKILDNADVSVYITLYSSYPHTSNYKTSSTVDDIQIEIGVVCHNDCRSSMNGIRDIELITRARDILCSDRNIGGIGKLRSKGIRSLWNMPNPDYSGFSLLVEASKFGDM